MTMPVPAEPKIYHIAHYDRLPSIVADGFLWCGAEIAERGAPGTTIGMKAIKERRLNKPILKSHPDLYVGDCVPFYFCPRSVMLYVIHRGDHNELEYRGGQEPVIHLESDFYQVVDWAKNNKRRWAFTTSNAGSSYFKDYADLADLDKVDWHAVQARDWEDCRDYKQAEFLVEQSLPWELVSRIGVRSQQVCEQVEALMQKSSHRLSVEVKPDWYYDDVPAKPGRAQFPVGPLPACDAPAGADTNSFSIGGRITEISNLKDVWEMAVNSGRLEHTRHTPTGKSQRGWTHPPVTVYWRAGQECAYKLDVIGRGSYVILHGRMTANQGKYKVLESLDVERVEVLRAVNSTAWAEYQAEVEDDSEGGSVNDEIANG